MYQKNVNVNGALGAANSILCFWGNDENEVTFSFAGSESGKNTTVVCGFNNTCYISCFSSSCNDITLLCDDDNINDKNCSFVMSCTATEKSDVCDGFGYVLPVYDEYDVPSLIDENVTFVGYTYQDNIDSGCNNLSSSTNNAVDCNDYQACKNSDSILGNNNNSLVCCTGYESCFNGTNITGMNIECSGYQGCTQIQDYISATGAASIYLSGMLDN